MYVTVKVHHYTDGEQRGKHATGFSMLQFFYIDIFSVVSYAERAHNFTDAETNFKIIFLISASLKIGTHISHR